MTKTEKKSSGNEDRKKKILIIEDDKFISNLISGKLNKEGFLVVETVSGDEGIRKAKEGLFDLVLLDLVMPGFDEFGVLKRLKEDSSTASIPVVIYSNVGEQEMVEEGLKLGAVDYWIKAHFTPTEILERVKDLLKKK